MLTFPFSRPSCHFPLDCVALRRHPYSHSLRGRSKTDTVGNDYSASHFRGRKDRFMIYDSIAAFPTSLSLE